MTATTRHDDTAKASRHGTPTEQEQHPLTGVRVTAHARSTPTGSETVYNAFGKEFESRERLRIAAERRPPQ
ncbi:hypothetical protein JCM17823_14640 [Halorubrum gandharaense]